MSCGDLFLTWTSLVYGIRCSSWLKYLLVFGFNFSLVQKIFQVDLTWSSRFFQLKYYSNILCTSWCIAESKGIVEKSISLTHYFECEELNLLVIFY